jgi:transcriptional regulator with XRE-family HTH domain
VPVDAELLRLGRRIRACREAQQLSQEELAERAGLHRNYVGLVERGERTASVKTIFALARGLGLQPIELWRFE